MNKFLNGSLQSLLLGWLICNVCLHAEFVDLQAEPKFVAYSNSIDYSGHSIGEAFYHADTFAAINRNVMPLPARATGTHGLPSGITPSQATPTEMLAPRLGGHGAPHQGTSHLGSVSEHQASHASGVIWVDERAAMSSRAKIYNDSASGARSDVISKAGQAPSLSYTTVDGVKRTVRFDGVDGSLLIDRKVAVVTTEKSMNQAKRQSDALAQNGLSGAWEVPDAAQANRAQKMFEQLNIKNIEVRIVDVPRV